MARWLLLALLLSCSVVAHGWVTQVCGSPAVLGTPVVVGSMVVVYATDTSNNESAIVAMDTASGQVLWTTSVNFTVVASSGWIAADHAGSLFAGTDKAMSEK